MKQKKFGQAIELFGRAMGLAPYDHTLLVAMGEAYEATGETASALAVYDEALKNDPGNPDICLMMASILFQDRDYEGSIRLIRAGLAKSPENAGLNFLLGDAYRMSDKPLEAIDAYENAGKSGGREFAEAYRQAGFLYYRKLVDVINAEKVLRKYIRLGGKDAEVDEILLKISLER
jgi:tetratricopeptide (TPR) repeat protein